MALISKDAAIQLIHESSRYSHSIIVSTIMYHLAKTLSEDQFMWELVGLLHDLDYDHVQHDMSLHGLVASETLKNKLPAEARYAIQCHNHRTGVTPQSSLDIALIIADSLANILDNLSEPIIRDRLSALINQYATDKPWLSGNLQRSHELGIPQQTLIDLCIEIYNKMQQWIRVCPRCFSPRISPQTQGFWIWSTHRYQCHHCQYHGSNFVELRLVELERLTDHERR